MQIKKLCMGPVQTNCYILRKANSLIIIDPSFSNEKEYKRFQREIATDDKIIAVLLTHGHYDHISGVNQLLKDYPCPLYISFDEVEFLTNEDLNLSTQFGIDYIVETKPIEVIEGLLSIGEFEFNVFKTPGHTAGSITYIIGEHAFDGDFIFRGSIGRTDLPTGSQKDMSNALKTFVDQQDLYLKLYPGHGEVTTLHFETMTNMYLKQLL